MDIKTNAWNPRISLHFIKNLMIIRRVEFFIVELTIFSLPILISVGNMNAFLQPYVLEGFLLFFILYSLGDMINCWADRNLDRKYKTRLSRAVFELGPDFVRNIVITEAVVAFLLALHLSWVSGKWTLFYLVLFGMFLGIQYSIPPFYFKSRGVFHVICLWLLLFFVPMIYSGLLVLDRLTLPAIIVSLSYSTIGMGIILINTSEDLPEDRESNVRTTTVALGLKPTLWLATTMVLTGGVVFVAFWTHTILRFSISYWNIFVLMLLISSFLYVFTSIFGLALRVSAAKTEDIAIKHVKDRGMHVPIWATLVGWTGVICGIALVLAKNMNI